MNKGWDNTGIAFRPETWAALAAHPEIPSETGRGEFGVLHSWLKENIYRHGRKYTASELLHRVTGGGLDIAPYIRYLRGKFGELYSR